MVNDEIADIFRNISSYYAMNDDQKSFFRSRAYDKASDTLSKFPYDLSEKEWYEDMKKLKAIEGIGQSTAEQIVEYVKTGKIKEYEDMKESSPVKLEELLRIQGVGPKTILKLYKKLGVTDVVTLKKAAESGEIADLEGFGKKKEQNILESIDFAILNKDRISIATAEEQVKKLLDYMNKDNHIKQIEIGGSYRRKQETVGDVDILVSSDNPEKTMVHFVNYSDVEKVLGHGETKSSIWLKVKLQVDIRVVPKESFGAALQYFTGNVDHNVKVRNIAISKGYKLSEYGLFERKKEKVEKNGKKVAGENEKEIYKKLGLQYPVPELRQDRGEIEAAQKNVLPELIELSDVKGDLQMHTTHSDGVNSIEEMAKKAKLLGYKYIGITDHFGKLYVANAIVEKEFDKYIRSIKKADENVNGIKIFASAEVEIGKDGELEFDEKKLRQLDYVIAAVHFSTKMSMEDMTKRLIKAIQNPLTKIIAHPTGRIIGQRPGFEFDYEKVFQTAKDENVAMEINASPMRLDLNDELAKLAKDIGCKLVINTDAHSIEGLEDMHFGVNSARRSWLEKNDLLHVKDINLLV